MGAEGACSRTTLARTTDPICGDRNEVGSSSSAAVVGYPNITVPAGQVFGLPVGISFFGRADGEPTLLRIAFGFEQATRARIPSQFGERGTVSLTVDGDGPAVGLGEGLDCGGLFLRRLRPVSAQRLLEQRAHGSLGDAGFDVCDQILEG